MEIAYTPYDIGVPIEDAVKILNLMSKGISLTSAQQAQIRTNIYSAPAGYGLGETVGNSGYIASAAALDATVKGGIYYYYNSDEQATGYPYSQLGIVAVIAAEAVADLGII